MQWQERGDVDVDIGANPSAEGGDDEGVESNTQKVVDLIDAFRLNVSCISSQQLRGLSFSLCAADCTGQGKSAICQFLIMHSIGDAGTTIVQQKGLHCLHQGQSPIQCSNQEMSCQISAAELPARQHGPSLKSFVFSHMI